MGRLALVLLFAAALAGCATSPMKPTPLYEGSDAVFSEGAGDRVNLWPLYYSRRPAQSILWPLYSEADDHWAIRPLYSQYRPKGGEYDEFNVLWPLCQVNTRADYNWIGPVLWSAHGFSVFPLYYDSSVGVDASETFWALGGLTGFRKIRGRLTWHWLVPLYVRNGDDNFYSLPYATEKNGRLGSSNWFLAGLGGHRTDEHGKLMSTWALPFYYQDDERLVTTFYGRTKDASWTVPLYYSSDTCSANLLYVHEDDPRTGEGALTIPLLLSRSAWSKRGARSLYTLPYGWTGGGTAQTNTWWATPLVGTHAGRRTGWWAFPLYDRAGDPSYGEKAAALDGDAIPPSVEFVRETLVDVQGKSRTQVSRKGEAVRTDDEATFLTLFDWDRHLADRIDEKENCYRLAEQCKIGNRLLFNWECRREKLFDLSSRQMLDEKTSSEYSFLWRFFRYEKCSGAPSRLDILFLPVMR